jgi:phage host-nuclease inhibitor protein Gam
MIEEKEVVEFETVYDQDAVELPEVPITDNHDAERHLRALAYWEDEEEKILAHAAREMERVQAWKEAEVNRINRKSDWHRNCLISFARAQDKPTVKLINGTIKRFKGRESINVIDENALFQWATEKSLPEMVRTKTIQEPDKKTIKLYIDSSGEIPNGVQVIKKDDTYDVEVN